METPARPTPTILALCLLAWLTYTLLDDTPWSDERAARETQEDGATDLTGESTGGPAATDPATKGRRDDRTTIADANRFRARVVRASGEPVTHFWVGVLPPRPGSARYLAPALEVFGTHHDLREGLVAHAGVREIETTDGWFDLEEVVNKRVALFLYAADHAVLFAIGEPFGTAKSAPVFVLEPEQQRRIRVLDHDDESPVTEAKLILRRFGTFDFIARLRSEYGNGGLRIPVDAATGLRSDADGLIRIPLRVRAAVYQNDAKAVVSTLLLPLSFTVNKPGYHDKHKHGDR